ncbi:2-polyprenyl-6-methoxyphenol hydroxylase and related FAD-dependent oxidoreductase [Hahella chejuensis KCTC 2396]|uniref:2-polyprenyl-6-methoxyphenol hydroxylase and related FAD-dependent oxidoreductase n=1 Tax=Hahella chejuensis (strain KCTC 2396) TaxID=349521 RepID=Q2SNW7_HAHCH|nr:FAD-dependent monooxygenase [Hahella chejuensis]ABC27657.1 2-polyprenyl-6-methoxyphenol hydroxylase and related FAD-dependent oxidoreductase [Hahella chejuensis KCTC 2396]
MTDKASSQPSDTPDYDVIIVGGGMVGAAIAAALKNTVLRIAVIEREPPVPFNPDETPDLRVSAINFASEKFLTQLGAWERVLQMRAHPYQRLAVWEKLGNPLGERLSSVVNKTEFDSRQVGHTHLGHIVENRVIQLALLRVVEQAENTTLISGRRIRAINFRETFPEVTLDDQSILRGRLIVGADGGSSMVREQAQLGLLSDAYEQHALVISVAIAGEPQDITWQAFRPHGPLAFLPLCAIDGVAYASLVWYDQPAKLKALQQLSQDDFLRALRKEFPRQLPELLHVLGKGSFPLVKRHAQHYVAKGVALAGDAAHTINPLAGQGVNLGFQDAAALAEVIRQAAERGPDIGDLETLRQYERLRRGENLKMMTLMDGFYYAFSNNLAPVKLARNLGLGLAGLLGPAKRKVVAYAMGLNGAEAERPLTRY